MFRCLGDDKKTPREAYTELRNKMGSVLNTDAGLILGHVLKGMDLALDCQAQLYLLFDKSEYLGFSLLGEEFAVWINGGWKQARSAEELRADLATFFTSEQALVLLSQKIASMSVGMDGLDSITVGDLDSAAKILKALSLLKIEGDDSANKEKELYSLVGKCNLSGNYLSITPENIVWAIEQLTSKFAEPFDDKKYTIYIPPSGWNEIAKKQFYVLSAFGPRSFSFRNAKGDEFKIQDPKEPKSKWGIMDGKMDAFGLMVYVKSVLECNSDWDALVETGKVRADYTERAGSVRAHKLVAKGKKLVWDCLWANLKSFGIGAPETEETKKEKGKGKAVVAEEIDEKAFEAFF